MEPAAWHIVPTKVAGSSAAAIEEDSVAAVLCEKFQNDFKTIYIDFFARYHRWLATADGCDSYVDISHGCFVVRYNYSIWPLFIVPAI